MSVVNLKRKEVVAKKEYNDDCYDHLNWGLLKVRGGEKTLDIEEAYDLGISIKDIETLQAACDRNFKILPGEKHIYIVGKYDDEFYTCRFSLAISAILNKYELWYEE